MKRIAALLVLFAFAGPVFSSCVKENEEEEPQKMHTVSFSAMSDGFVWSEGDAISVFSNSMKTKFAVSVSEGPSCTFTGRVSGKGSVTAVYPFDTEATFRDGAIVLTVPSSQEVSCDSSIVAVGQSAKAGDPVSFGTVVSPYYYSIDEEIASRVLSVTVQSNDGTKIAGKSEITFANGIPAVKVVEGTDKVVVKGSFKAGDYSVLVYPVGASKLSVSMDLAPEPEYEPTYIELLFSNGTSFSNPFATPDLMKLSSTMNTPSYPSSRTELSFNDGASTYLFYLFGTKGAARNSAGGLCFGTNAGDYLEFPGIPGMFLNSVTMTCGSALSGASIVGADGKSVLGGSMVESSGARGDVVTWNLFRSEKGKAYRLVNASGGSIAIQKIVLEFGPVSKKAPTGGVSPFDYGLKEATTGEARYEAIYNAHKAAVGMGLELDYTGVGTVEMVIPSNGKSIPLPHDIDFKGTVFKVLNTSKKLALFSMTNTFKPVTVTGAQIDSKDYSSVPELATGLHILRIQDDSLWVENREGYTYGATRRDVVLVRDGKGSNGPCAPYATAPTRINATYCDAEDAERTIKNARLERDAKSTVITNFFTISGYNNLHMVNVAVVTPDNTGIYGDGAIGLQNCTNLLCEDVLFDGLYNDTSEFGYGFSGNNCWHSTFRRITSHTKWAGFGCNNMNDSILEDSDVERFDTHCYGRDITIRNTTLTGKGIPTASMFGTIYCEKVNFVNCYVYSMRSDYNSYVPFDIVLKDCEFTPKSQPALINMGRLDTKINSRPELAKKNWPNLEIDGLKVNFSSVPSSFSMYHLASNPTYANPVGYISKVKIKDLTYVAGGKTVKVATNISSKNVKVENPLVVEIVNSDYNYTINFTGNVTRK